MSKRPILKRKQRAREWVNSLTNDQVLIIEKIVEMRVKEELDKMENKDLTNNEIDKNIKKLKEENEKAISRVLNLKDAGTSKADIIKILKKEFGYTSKLAETIYKTASKANGEVKVIKKEAVNLDHKENKGITFPVGLKLDVIQGTYKGLHFKKDKEGLQVGELHFKDMQELETYRKEEAARTEEEIKSLKDKLEAFYAETETVEELIKMEV